MKTFLIKTMKLVFFCFLIQGAILLGRFYYVNGLNWKVDKNITTLFMGASHIQKGINPEYYPNSMNLASSSERYLFTYLKLKQLLLNNPQINTLVLQFAPTDTHSDTDSKYFGKNEISHFVPLYFPYFSSSEWRVYSNSKQDILTTLIQKSIKGIPEDIDDFGGYTINKGVFDRNTPSPSPNWSKAGSKINFSYLDKIIQLCQEYNVEVTLIYMPMYNKAHYYDTKAFYATYSEKYADVTFLDYSDWKCPDNYRKDEHHLNNEGAIEFTRKLKLN